MKILQLIILFLIAAAPLKMAAADTNSIVLYSTGFEQSEGFDPNNVLMNQNGWVGYGDGGNGLVDSFFPGMGQQAYIGFTAGTNTSLVLWYTNINVKTQYSRVQFSVDMSIIDSTNGFYDDFGWSVYNTNGDKLFSVDFDNYAQTVTYSLDDDVGFISTGRKFTNGIIYNLVIDMDFSLNLWSAFIDSNTILSNLPIVKTSKILNFSDADAVWVFDGATAGNNYMLFDNYRILVPKAPLATLNPPRFQTIQRVSANLILLRLTGQTNQLCHMDYSDDLKRWNSLKNASFSDAGTLDVVDDSATTASARFYRANYTR